MIAYGLGAGQRHRRMLGAVANVVKAGLKTGPARKEIDMKFMGAMSITYALYESQIPQEIMQANNAALDSLGLPPTWTETIPPGVFDLFIYFPHVLTALYLAI